MLQQRPTGFVAVTCQKIGPTVDEKGLPADWSSRPNNRKRSNCSGVAPTVKTLAVSAAFGPSSPRMRAAREGDHTLKYRDLREFMAHLERQGELKPHSENA